MGLTELELEPATELTRREAHHLLSEASSQRGNSEPFARMLASQRAGEGAMPVRLGLTRRQFEAMMARHFPGLDPALFAEGDGPDLERAPEREDLRRLFLARPEWASDEHGWVADIVIAGCMGGNHLWQDMGLWSRADLSELLGRNFPELTARNDRDMKWKKFFYKQLCNAEGIHTCRAPSCEVCEDFQNCFGSED